MVTSKTGLYNMDHNLPVYLSFTYSIPWLGMCLIGALCSASTCVTAVLMAVNHFPAAVMDLRFVSVGGRFPNGNVCMVASNTWIGSLSASNTFWKQSSPFIEKFLKVSQRKVSLGRLVHFNSLSSKKVWWCISS